MKIISAIDAMIKEVDAFASTSGASNHRGRLICTDSDLAFRLKALIKYARIVSGRTAQDLCRVCEIKYVTQIYEYESLNGRCPSPELAKRILIALKGMIMGNKKWSLIWS